jgi:hypothetical protein
VSRYAVISGLTLMASCAGAGDGSGDPSTLDAPRAPDAAIHPDPPPAPMNVCPSAQTCQAATMLGTVSGDTDSTTLTVTGYRSAWFRVRVTENYNDIFGYKLRVSAKLTSPAAVDFDVFVYVNAGSDVIECSTTVGTPTTNGTMNETRTQWGEGSAPNGVDDDRDVSIEVRPISGTCAPNQMWQLAVEGNWE